MRCTIYTREQVTHYFHIKNGNGRLKCLDCKNYEHYLCHAETCIDWRCIGLRAEIRQAAKAAEVIAKITGP